MDTFERFYNTFLPIDLSGEGKNKTADCPFCEREHKFSVNIENGMAQCLSASCGETCNHISFLTKFHDAWFHHTEPRDLERLSTLRGISVNTLIDARLAYDKYKDRWLVPYKHPFTDDLTNLGNFCEDGDNAFRIYKAPNVNSELPLTLYNPYQNLANPNPKVIYLAEGEWDALALIDIFKDSSKYVMAAPGALIFPDSAEKWLEKFDVVNLVYDFDDAGRKGITKVTPKLQRWNKHVFKLNWEAMDGVTNHCDARDLLVDQPEAKDLILSNLIESDSNQEVDPEDLSAGYVTSIADIKPLGSFEEYIDAFSIHHHLNECNVTSMAATMAVSTSQYMKGEPLWVFLIGPPGAGKTALIESYGGKNEYFDYASRITAKSLVSGWRSGGDDPSMIMQMTGKTFFIKDFTVVLGMPAEQRKEVFNLLRDIYDGTLKITYGNGVVQDLHQLKFNVVAGVTDAIKTQSDASMGERFLRIDYTGFDIDDAAIINTALKGFGQTDTKKEELTAATLGYVKTIFRPENRWNINNLPRLGNDSVQRISSLARYTAYIRTRPEHDRQDGIKYRPRREIATRLAFQYAKLAYGLEKVYQPSAYRKANNAKGTATIDLTDRTLQAITKVAYDTSECFNQEVLNLVHKYPGLGRKDIEAKLKINSTRVHKVITDLKALRLIRTVTRVEDGRPQVPLDKRGRGKDADRGRPSEYYSVASTMLPVLDNLFPENRQG